MATWYREQCGVSSRICSIIFQSQSYIYKFTQLTFNFIFNPLIATYVIQFNLQLTFCNLLVSPPVRCTGQIIPLLIRWQGQSRIPSSWWGWTSKTMESSTWNHHAIQKRDEGGHQRKSQKVVHNLGDENINLHQNWCFKKNLFLTTTKRW